MKIGKIIKSMGLLIIFVFLFCYFLESSGYYEYNLQNKKNMTEEQILLFENDVKEGREIDLNSYLVDANVDYSSPLTRTASQANLKLNDYLKKILTSGIDILGKFIK